MEQLLDPYRDWLGIEDKQRPLTLYQLLRLDPSESRAERIEQAADRQIAAVQKHLKGPNARFARRTLYELESAKQCLLDPTKRRGYDEMSATGAPARSLPKLPSLEILGDGDDSIPLLSLSVDGAAATLPALDNISRDSISALLDEPAPAAEPPATSAPSAAQLAALGIVPQPARAPAPAAWKKITIVGLIIAVPTACIFALLWLAIQWFDGPSKAANPAVAAGIAKAATIAPPHESPALPTGDTAGEFPVAPQSAESAVASAVPAVSQGALAQPGAPLAPAPLNVSARGNSAAGANRPFGDAIFSASLAVVPSQKTSPQHGSLLGPSNSTEKGQPADESTRRLSPWRVNFDKDSVNLPLDDAKLPKSAPVQLEITGFEGFPSPPEMMPGAIVAGGKLLRLVVRQSNPRVEIRLRISGGPGERILNIRSVLIDGGPEGPAAPLTNERLATMAAKLPGEFEAARAKFNSVDSTCAELQQQIDRLSNSSVNNAVEATARNYTLRTSAEQLRRLTVQRTNLGHAAERLGRRLQELPAIVQLKGKIDGGAMIRFRVFADVEGRQVELGGTAKNGK
jgi:hypothetical protein